jgi:hypothetical protein
VRGVQLGWIVATWLEPAFEFVQERQIGQVSGAAHRLESQIFIHKVLQYHGVVTDLL